VRGADDAPNAVLFGVRGVYVFLVVDAPLEASLDLVSFEPPDRGDRVKVFFLKEEFDEVCLRGMYGIRAFSHTFVKKQN